MKMIRIIVAIGVTTAMIYFYPSLHSMMDTLNAMATSMCPGMPTFDSTFLGILPIIALGAIIWWGITYAIGKISEDSF
jgi:hypothetical protein